MKIREGTWREKVKRETKETCQIWDGDGWKVEKEGREKAWKN